VARSRRRRPRHPRPPATEPKFTAISRDEELIPPGAEPWVRVPETDGDGPRGGVRRGDDVRPSEVLIRSGLGEGRFWLRPAGVPRSISAAGHGGPGSLGHCGRRSLTALDHPLCFHETWKRGRDRAIPDSEVERFLATRERGRRVREDIEAQLAAMAAGETLSVDFADVEGITVSFATSASPSSFSPVRPATSSTVASLSRPKRGRPQTLETVLEHARSRRVPDRTATWRSSDSTIAATDAGVAQELRSFKAAELAARLGITPQAVNNRLKLLVASVLSLVSGWCPKAE